MKHNATSAPRAAGAAIVAAGLLTACFGGGDGVNPPAPPMAATAVPDSALVSSTAYESFTNTTASSSTETAEPLTADNISTPPSSETDEPASVS